MKPVTIRFDGDVLDELDGEAEQRGVRSRSELIRRIVRDWLEEGGGPDGDPGGEHLEDRLEDLENRIADIAGGGDSAEWEDRQTTLNGDDDEGDDPTLITTFDTDEAPAADADDPAVERALEGWDPGRTREERERARDAAAAVLAHLSRSDGARRRELIDAAYEATNWGQSEDSWWRRTVRPALDHAATNGAVETDESGRIYSWVGDAVDEDEADAAPEA